MALRADPVQHGIDAVDDIHRQFLQSEDLTMWVGQVYFRLDVLGDMQRQLPQSSTLTMGAGPVQSWLDALGDIQLNCPNQVTWLCVHAQCSLDLTHLVIYLDVSLNHESWLFVQAQCKVDLMQLVIYSDTLQLSQPREYTMRAGPVWSWIDALNNIHRHETALTARGDYACRPSVALTWRTWRLWLRQFLCISPSVSSHFCTGPARIVDSRDWGNCRGVSSVLI